jgi:hypothetical protein
MSKNRSKKLARSAGGHRVFQPIPIKAVSVVELKKHINFITLASGRKNINSIIDSFSKILSTFETNPRVVDEVSKRIGLSKQETVSTLTFYRNEYKDAVDIRHLLFKEW